MARRSTPRTPAWAKLLAALIAALGAWLGKDALGGKPSDTPKTSPRAEAAEQGSVAPRPAKPSDAPDMSALLDAARDQRSGVWVAGVGKVVKVLSDDVEGVPHQRFLVTVEGLEKQTIKISNNLQLGERVPVEKGDEVRFTGQFEWNPDLGGAVHWTHDDPAGKHKAGWIEHEGKRYQ